MQQKHLNENDMATDILVGVSDGLIVPFALATGLSVVIKDTNTIIAIGAAATILGALGMALSRYYAGREEAHNHHDEHHNIHFDELGLSDEERQAIANSVEQEKEHLRELVDSYELDKFNPAIARKSALNIGISYALAGLFPLAPYLLIKDHELAFRVSVITTMISLFIFGFLKARYTGLKGLVGGLRSLIIGCCAAAAVFAIAKIFG
jgi:vacuolar iron transporter family protein